MPLARRIARETRQAPPGSAAGGLGVRRVARTLKMPRCVQKGTECTTQMRLWRQMLRKVNF